MRRVALVTSSSMMFLLACARSHDAGGGAQACRWRLGDAVEIGDVGGIARSGGTDGLAGAVHASRDAALVIASTEGGLVGALVTTTERAEVLATFEPSGGAAHSTESGFALSTYPDCAIELVDDELDASGTLDLGVDLPDARCLLSQSVAGRIEVAVSAGTAGLTTVHSVSGLGTAEPVVDDLGALGSPDASVLRVVHQPDWGTWVWVNGPRGYGIERLDGASPTSAYWPMPDGLAGSTADHRRGGIVVVARRDPPTGDWGPWQLEWFGPDGDLGAPVVTTLPDVWPSEEPAATSDGAFVPLHEGLLAFFRWGEPGMQILRHDDGDRVLQSRAIVRAGGDRGGLLYTMDDGGTAVLRWRPLICDR